MGNSCFGKVESSLPKHIKIPKLSLDKVYEVQRRKYIDKMIARATLRLDIWKKLCTK